MNLLDLPVDVGVLILNYLDTQSKIDVYNSCVAVRRFFSPRHVRRVVLPHGGEEVALALRQELFLQLGHHVRALGLAAAPDLAAPVFAPALAPFTNLRTLDVAFTDIYLPDLVDICPRYLKNIDVNFFKRPRRSRREPAWERCREMFRRQAFDDVHLIIFDFMDSDAPLAFLQGVPPVRNLKVTVADNYRDFWEDDDEDEDEDAAAGSGGGGGAGGGVAAAASLCYVFRDCRVSHRAAGCLRGVASLDYDQLEYLFIMYLEKIVVYVSPAFRHIFRVDCCDLAVEVHRSLPLGFTLDGNILFKAWNRATTVFDEKFTKDLLAELKDYFPTYVCMHGGVKMKVTDAPSDWYCIDACSGFERLLDELPTKVTLTNFCRREGVVKRGSPAVRLAAGAARLRRLTFLRLSNVRVHRDFFAVLFAECARLHTLDLYAERGRGYTAALAGALAAAASLRNLKLTAEDVEYEALFAALSRCQSLENVHVCEYERASGECVVPAALVERLVASCARLRCVFVEAGLPPASLTLLAGALRAAAQRRGRPLRLEVAECYRGWNPCGDVFSPSPIHVLE